MNPSHWKLTKAALATAMELPTGEREPFLAALPDEFRADVARLLSADEHADSFINEPILVERGVVTDDAEPDDAEGQIIDGYRLIRKIGSGGMGAVYLADQSGEGFSQKVALKLIKRGMDTGAVLKRFLMERQILANLEHPNIARMLDGGSTTEGLPYFVMEYVDGEEVRDYCNGRKLGLVQRLELFRKICEAVANAHQKLVVHRDLKPSNILVTKDGEPKLLDFGIAKLTSPDWNADTKDITVTQFRIMTPEYASPEQLAGEVTATSTDIYSLGVVLYELMTGERPHLSRGKTPKEIADSILSSDPPKPSTVGAERASKTSDETEYQEQERTSRGPDLRTRSAPEIVEPRHLQGDLDNIILKAMRREPEQRYQSVQEFSEDIRRYLQGLPVHATAISKLYRFKKYFKRHRVSVIGVAAAAVFLLTATAVTGWQYAVAEREKAAAERRFADTRALAKSVLYEIYDAIDAVPGSTKAKELLALKAIEYLDRLAAEGSNDPYLLTELADGYQRIGDIQGGMGRSNLGQTAEAKESYAKSRTLREAVVASGASDPKFRFKLAMGYTKAAESDLSEANVKGYYENHLLALETLKDLETLLPDDEDYLFEFGASYANNGQAAAANGNLDEGIEYLKKAETILGDLYDRNPSDLKRAMGVSGINHIISDLLFPFRKAEALNYMNRSASYIFPLLEANPDNADLHRNAAAAYYGIARVECDLGKYDEAMANTEKAIEIVRNLHDRDEQNADLSLIYTMALYSKAKILVRSGRPADGLPILEDILQRANALQTGDPANEVTKVRAAFVDEEFGRAYLAIGLAETRRAAKINALQQARSWLQKAHETHKKYHGSIGMLGEDADVLVGQVAELISKCDAALKAASTR